MLYGVGDCREFCGSCKYNERKLLQMYEMVSILKSQFCDIANSVEVSGNTTYGDIVCLPPVK